LSARLRGGEQVTVIHPTRRSTERGEVIAVICNEVLVKFIDGSTELIDEEWLIKTTSKLSSNRSRC